MIPYGRQAIDDDDIDAVVSVLRGDWLTQGPTIERFERAVADYVGAEHAVAFSSGTAALHGAAFAAGLGPGDVAYTSPLTFMASANCIRYVGATPGLIDIRPDTWNMDLRLLPEDAAGVVVVHFAGLPVDLVDPGWGCRPPVVIEDAAHALGAHTPDGPVGNCARSDLCCFSFHPVKPITAGEGGMVTTNNSDLAERMRRFRSHGIVRMPERGGWYYEINEVGFNYRMTDIQAALGLSQMSRLDSFIERRNEIAEWYREQLVAAPVGLPARAPVGYRHGYHLFPVRVRDRGAVHAGLAAAGVGAQVHYVPVHHHPLSTDVQIDPRGLGVSDQVYSEILSLPMYPALTEADLRFVTDALHSLTAEVSSV